MEAHEAMERFEHAEEAVEARESFARHAAVLVAILAALLAIAALAGNRASEQTILNQGKAFDAFNELEANSIKKHVNNNDASLLRVLAAPAGRRAAAISTAAALDAKAAQKYAPAEARLLEKAHHFEHEQERAENHHRTFQIAEAAFQIGIVLSSVAIVARAIALLFVGGGLGLVGLFLLIDGFTLFWHLP